MSERSEIVKAWHDEFNGEPKISIELADPFCQKFHKFLRADISNEKYPAKLRHVNPCLTAYFFYLDEIVDYCTGGAA